MKQCAIAMKVFRRRTAQANESPKNTNTTLHTFHGSVLEGTMSCDTDMQCNIEVVLQKYSSPTGLIVIISLTK
jgi:hypothetical protein